MGLSAERVTIYGVDVSAADIAKIPAGNVRLRRAQFVALWETAERFHDEQIRRGAKCDWFGASSGRLPGEAFVG